MKCINCGLVLEDGKYCPECGEKLVDSNKKKDTSVVLGIISMAFGLIFSILSPIGIVLGIIGLIKAKKSNNDLGHGLSVAGVVICSFICILFVILMIIFYSPNENSHRSNNYGGEEYLDYI